MCVEVRKANCQDLVLSFHQEGSREQTQAVKLGGK